MKRKIFQYISPSTITGSDTTHNKMNVQFDIIKRVKFLQNLLQSHYPQDILTDFVRMGECAIRWSKKSYSEVFVVGGMDLNLNFDDECEIRYKKSEFNSVGNGRW